MSRISSYCPFNYVVAFSPSRSLCRVYEKVWKRKLKVLHLKHKQRINHGSMNAVNLHKRNRPVRECCVEAKVLSRKQPAFKIFSLLFCFVLFLFRFVYYILRKHFLNHSFRPLFITFLCY